LDKDHLKLEADRLSKDPVLIEAVARIRLQALEGLVKADPAKTNEIIALQERVKVCDAFATTLKTMINSAQQRQAIKPV
jgi:hypothetical protein